MNANWWLWIALIAFVVFCCLPMLRGRRRRSPHDAAKEEEKNSGK